MDPQKLALLKKALRNLSGAIDVLSEREREQLKELIVKGQVSSEEDLRGYLSRLIASRARVREKEKQKADERRQLARKASAEEDAAQHKKPTPAEEEEEGELEKVEREEGTSPASQGKEGDHGKITGKVIDAKSRKNLSFARVRVVGTSFNEETETTGVFIWEELPLGRQVTFEVSKKGYKSAMLQYRSSLDAEQHIVVKLVPQENKGDKKPGDKKGGGH